MSRAIGSDAPAHFQRRTGRCLYVCIFIYICIHNIYRCLYVCIFIYICIYNI
jgi:hypothetical protein